MSGKWPRFVIGAIAALITAYIGITSIGGVGEADPDTGLVPGAPNVMFILALALLVGLVAYAIVEFAQTRRLDSITRQFDTRTIVLMPIAIAINIVLGQTVGTALKIPLYLDSIGTILVGALAGPIPGALTGLLANLIWTFVLAGTPFGSPYAWPYAIVAAEIGLMAGFFGYWGFFRSRPNTPAPRLIAGLVVAVAFILGIFWYGVLPFYAEGFTFFGDTSAIEPFFVALAWAIAIGVGLALAALVIQVIRKRDLGVAYVVVAGAIVGVISALISAPITLIFFGGVTGSGSDLLVAAFQQAGSSLYESVFQQGLLQDPIDKTIEFLLVFVLLGALSRRFISRFPQGERAVGLDEA